MFFPTTTGNYMHICLVIRKQCSDLFEISDRKERTRNFIAVNCLQVEHLVFSTVFHVIWHIWFPADSVDPHQLSTASENEMISGTSEVKVILQFNHGTFSTQDFNWQRR